MSGAPKQLLSKIPDQISWRFPHILQYPGVIPGGSVRSFDMVSKCLCIFFPHPLRWFSVLELSLRQAGSGFRNLQLFFCYFLPLSWSWVGDKVAARPLKNNIGNVMEGKNNSLILSSRARSHFVESFFLCSMRSHIRELNKNYEWSFSFCKSKKFWLIHSIVAQREEGDTKLRWLIKKEEEKRVRRGK